MFDLKYLILRDKARRIENERAANVVRFFFLVLIFAFLYTVFFALTQEFPSEKSETGINFLSLLLVLYGLFFCYSVEQLDKPIKTDF